MFFFLNKRLQEYEQLPTLGNEDLKGKKYTGGVVMDRSAHCDILTMQPRSNNRKNCHNFCDRKDVRGR